MLPNSFLAYEAAASAAELTHCAAKLMMAQLHLGVHRLVQVGNRVKGVRLCDCVREGQNLTLATCPNFWVHLTLPYRGQHSEVYRVLQLKVPG